MKLSSEQENLEEETDYHSQLNYHYNQDFVLQNMDYLSNLVFSESRINLDYFNIVLIYQFYRSYIFNFFILYFNSITCMEGEILFSFEHINYYYYFNIYGFLTLLVEYIQEINQLQNQHDIQYQSQQFCQNKHFGYQKLYDNIFKILVHSLVDSLLILSFYFSLKSFLAIGDAYFMELGTSLLFILTVTIQHLKIVSLKKMSLVNYIAQVLIYIALIIQYLMMKNILPQCRYLFSQIDIYLLFLVALGLFCAFSVVNNIFFRLIPNFLIPTSSRYLLIINDCKENLKKMIQSLGFKRYNRAKNSGQNSLNILSIIK